MIRLRLLGGAGLWNADGAEIPLSARKRFAFLAYLALANPRGFHSRDEVMAVFWPDLDEPRARAVLRQTLRLLRMDLGRDVVESRGSDLALSRSGIWCDAVAFEALLEAGSEAEALELYAGPLLDGFHYPRSSHAFEEWRDGQARRLQERAVRALWGLVEANGPNPASERLLRRLLQIARYDETALRWLMRSLAERGNRAEAVELYETFTDRLFSELEAEPSPETRALAELVRSAAPVTPPARVPRPTTQGSVEPDRPAARAKATDAPSSGAAPGPIEPSPGFRSPVEPSPGTPSPATPSPGTPSPDAPSSRKRRPPRPPRFFTGRMRTAAVPALLVLAGWGIWATAVSSPAPGEAEATTPLVVLPFDYRGDAQHAYLAAGIAGLVGDNLDGAGPIRTIRLGSEEGSSAETADVVAQRLGARLHLTGDVVESGGRLRVRAALHDGARAEGPRAQATAEGTTADVFALADRLAAALLREAPFRGARPARSAALTTSSLAALRAYLEGEEQLRAGRYDEAINAFEAAIREDTAFALAYHRLAAAAEWAPRPDLMTWATGASAHHAERLPHRERSLLEASLAWRRGEAEVAERRYREILRMYPDDGEAWFQLGEVLFHLNPLYGRSVRESETAWRRVLARDPGNREALVHLARTLSIDGRLDELDRAFPMAERDGANGDRRLLQIRALRAIDSGTPAARSRIARELRRESSVFWVDVWYVLAFSRNLDGTEPFLDLLVHPDEPAGLRAIGHVMRAHVRTAQGRWGDARAELAAAAELDPATALVYRGYLTTLPFVPASPSELERLRSDLLVWDPDRVPTSPDPRPAFTIHADLWHVLRHYSIGLASVRLGDLPEAEFRAGALIELARGPEGLGPMPSGGLGPMPSEGRNGEVEARVATELAADLARGLQARILAEAGRPEEALELLEGLGLRTTFERAFLSPFHARAGERYLRGALLLDLGRDRDALRAFDSAAQLSAYELVYLPFSHVARARIHDRAGEPELARRHFLEYRRLWSRADHGWREAVEQELRGVAVAARR